MFKMRIVLRRVCRWYTGSIGMRFLSLITILLVTQATSALTLKTFTEAVQSTFPTADNVKRQSIYLTQEQVARAAKYAGEPISTAFFVVYSVTRAGKMLGWVYLDTHRVRTLNETVFISIDPDHRVHNVQILNFHEPQEYIATDRFLALMKGRTLANKPSMRGDIPLIAGATLTSDALVSSVARILAVHKVITEGAR